MTTKKYAIAILMTLLFVRSVAAYDDICSAAVPYVRGTTIEVDKFSNKIKDHKFEGSGKVYDIKNGSQSAKYVVLIDCGNDVIASVPTNSTVNTDRLKRGTSISFSGTVRSVSRRHYADTQAELLLIGFEDNSSVW